MLRKLIKHELRATGRVMGPMLLLMLAAAVGGNIAVYHLVESDAAVLNMLGVLLLMGFFAAIAGAFIVSFVLMIRRFYKNLLRDEGYLMMTLPATVHEHVLSKLLVSVLWATATAAATILAMGILVFELEFAELIFRDLSALLAQLELSEIPLTDYAGHTALLVIEMILLALVADSCLCLQIYAALAVGHSFSHHKGLLSVASYFGLSIAWNLAQNGMIALLNRIAPEGIGLGLQNLSPFAAAHITLWGVILLAMIPAALWYAVTTWFLKNRLNLD